MSQYNNAPYAQSGSATRSGVAVDQGLRSYMLGVYNYMTLGVALTGVVAYAMFMLSFQQVGNKMGLTPLGQAIYGSPLKWVVMLAPLAVIIFMSVRSHRMSSTTAQLTFWVYAALVGLSVATIFGRFDINTIARTFFISAAAFAGLSIYGYATKRDLSGMGTFLVMGLIGVIIASIVHIGLVMVYQTPFPALSFAISCIALLIFAGFTAYDTQSIKEQYYELAQYGDSEAVAKSSIFGALALYQDFLGIFLNLLNLTGSNE
ncbi:MAG: Bax inhibitor-1/YccA family protein [Hyphomicrobiaceae bacterium]|nr:Bax inhibitor-1/YccA family protein [Hyphomicrobiaceae bacterium]